MSVESQRAARWAAPAAATIGWLVAVWTIQSREGLAVSDFSLLIAWTTWLAAAFWAAAHQPEGLRPTAVALLLVAVVTGAALCVAASRFAPPAAAAGVLLQLVLGAKRPRATLLSLPLLACTTAGLAEAALYMVRHISGIAALVAVQPLARQLYLLDLNIIQYLPECAQWDVELGYGLKPGECVFENTEFSTRYQINSLGLRDSEQALVGPEIIALGDSLTMGWGVEQHEAFPQRLGALTGRKTLNAGVSSYAAVRELRMLDRIERSHAQVLLLQYSSNDFGENSSFAGLTGALPVRDRAEYEEAVRGRGREVVYRFPRYSYRLYTDLLAKPALHRLHAVGWPPLAASEPSFGYNPDWREPEGRRREVDAFLAALRSSRLDLSPYRLLIFQLDEPDAQRDWFLPLLAETLSSMLEDEIPAHVELLDIGSKLTRGDFFDLDFHLTAAGHEKVAKMLAEALEAQ